MYMYMYIGNIHRPNINILFGKRYSHAPQTAETPCENTVLGVIMFLSFILFVFMITSTVHTKFQLTCSHRCMRLTWSDVSLIHLIHIFKKKSVINDIIMYTVYSIKLKINHKEYEQ